MTGRRLERGTPTLYVLMSAFPHKYVFVQMVVPQGYEPQLVFVKCYGYLHSSCNAQIILYKGFSMITNLAYEEEVPERVNEMWMGLVAQNLKVVIDAYILGTLFHYLVKKDPAEEASQELMRALKVYCEERDLPSSLYEKMQDYLRFQQQHSTSVTDHVIRVCVRTWLCLWVDTHKICVDYISMLGTILLFNCVL